MAFPTLSAFLFAYLCGGLTLLPLIAALCLLHAHWTLPRRDNARDDTIARKGDAEEPSESLKETLQKQSNEPDVAANYFAVCREYVPGGVNGRPPERTTPAGETIAAESPSVYQSMYRSIFDRNKTQIPTIEGGKPVKKARNVFFVVLRHSHLLLFDNADQIEVRHVIALEHYDIDVYAGGEDIPEGELWIKRNCIRLSRRDSSIQTAANSIPFFLFSENCSEKEDFYHALLHNQERRPSKTANWPTVQGFDTEDMIKLIRQLHTSEETSQTRWLNALIGRLFLALYKTTDVRSTIRTKIEKKMARVPKPAFITSLRLEEIAMGDCSPIFSNPKLREMTVDGGLTIEMDVKYSGSFKLVVAAVARIELGSRFKPREVNLVLAGILKKLEGHLLLRIKPPPSNRIWLAFEMMPKLEMSIEPVVSSRQITYGVILRAIESRIREVFSETMVLPNWDDSPFTHTENQRYRGGIWQDLENKDGLHSKVDFEGPELVDTNAEPAPFSAESLPALDLATPGQKAGISAASGSPPASPARSNTSGPSPSSAVDGGSPPSSPLVRAVTDKPRIMRTNSFGLAAAPVVTTGVASMDSAAVASRSSHINATIAMKTLSGRSADGSDSQPPVKPPRPSVVTASETVTIPSARKSSSTSTDDIPRYSSSADTTSGFPMSLQSQSISNSSIGSSAIKRTSSSGADAIKPNISVPSGHSRSLSKPTLTEKKATINQSISSASAAAKSWGWSMLNRQLEGSSPPHQKARSGGASLYTEPIGRGQPLPPIGSPLPKPERDTWSSAALQSLRRRPLSSTSTLGQHHSESSSEALHVDAGKTVHDGAQGDFGDADGDVEALLMEEDRPSPVLDESRRRQSGQGLADETERGEASTR